MSLSGYQGARSSGILLCKLQNNSARRGLENMSDERIILRWPGIFRPVFAVAALIGLFATFKWAVPVYTEGAASPSPAVFALILLAPIGVGFLCWTFQSIVVTEEFIESRFLGFRRRLDNRSTVISKVLSNGCTLRDGSGKKLFVHNMLIGSQQLFNEIAERQRKYRETIADLNSD